MKLETGKVGRLRCLKSSTIPMAINDKYRIIIKQATVRQMEHLFNALSYDLQHMPDISTNTLKKYLDIWLRTIPDTPKMDME